MLFDYIYKVYFTIGQNPGLKLFFAKTENRVYENSKNSKNPENRKPVLPKLAKIGNTENWFLKIYQFWMH